MKSQQSSQNQSASKTQKADKTLNSMVPSTPNLLSSAQSFKRKSDEQAKNIKQVLQADLEKHRRIISEHLKSSEKSLIDDIQSRRLLFLQLLKTSTVALLSLLTGALIMALVWFVVEDWRPVKVLVQKDGGVWVRCVQTSQDKNGLDYCMISGS